MTRVDELQKMYPTLPREYLVKWEVFNHGVRDSEIVDKVSEWTRSGSYQSRDLDVSLTDIAAKRPETARPGYVLRPRAIFMKNGIGLRIRRGSRTPYEVREEGEGKFALYEEQEKVEDIYFPAPMEWADQIYTSRGTPVSTLMTPRGRCFNIAPIRFCEYFTRGEQCKFCNYNETYEDARAIGTNLAVTINLEDTVEAYKIISSQVRLIEGRFQSGALSDDEKEATAQIGFIDRIANGASYKPNLTLSTQPPNRKGLQRMKDAGLDCIHFNMEVWGAELFAEVCPGKDKYKGFERYKQAYQEAVEIFGVGNVSCIFVAGVSLMPPNGPKTWQDARDNMLEGFRWLAKNGVASCFIGLRLGVGSIYGDDKSNWAKVPPTEFYLESAMGNHAILTEYGIYEKLNMLMWCPLDCPQGGCVGELGYLANYGDLGQAAAQVFPAEANWMAKFIASVRPPAIA